MDTWKGKAHCGLPDSSSQDMREIRKVLHHQLVSQTAVFPVEQHVYLTYNSVCS